MRIIWSLVSALVFVAIWVLVDRLVGNAGDGSQPNLPSRSAALWLWAAMAALALPLAVSDLRTLPAHVAWLGAAMWFIRRRIPRAE